jgi:heme/copper-type cytochrome/quinol oxidase subunit 2
MEKVETNSYFETPAAQEHKKQRFWQIIFPVALFAALMLAGLVFLIIRNGRFSPGITEISGVATVLIILPVLLVALIQLIILIAIIYGFSKLKAVIPGVSLTILQTLEKARWHIHKGADMSVQPILSLNQNSEKAKQIVRSLKTRLFEKRN